MIPTNEELVIALDTEEYRQRTEARLRSSGLKRRIYRKLTMCGFDEIRRQFLSIPRRTSSRIVHLIVIPRFQDLHLQGRNASASPC